MPKQIVSAKPDRLPTPRTRQAAAFDPACEIVKPSHLRAVIGLSGCTVWRLRRAGEFPAPIKLSVGRVGYRRADLENWLREREAASR